MEANIYNAMILDQKKLELEAMEIVESLNDFFWNRVETSSSRLREFIEYNPPLEFRSMGLGCSIELFEIQIWNSEDDERPYENEGTPQEDHIPLEKFIKYQILNQLETFAHLHRVCKDELIPIHFE